MGNLDELTKQLKPAGPAAEYKRLSEQMTAEDIASLELSGATITIRPEDGKPITFDLP
ncbi:hypothetical protein [Nocardia nova]|uniref:hypothetical protein n=1 Tax=Nocardia nova TaxID=37330 RepID=UPI002738F3BE|nr:hypothetical protein [Nocardia nova]